MNINKLSITPQDIDKNTGRIILPSAEELKEMSEHSQESSAQEAHIPLANIAPILGSQNALEAPPEMTMHTMHKRQPISMTKDSNHTRLPSSEMPATADHKGWLLTPMMMITLCICFFTLPLGFMCTFLMGENIQLKSKIDQITYRLDITEQRNQSFSISSLRENLTLKSDLATIKVAMKKVSQMQETQAIEKLNTTEVQKSEEIQAFIFQDVDGNVIPVNELTAGDYIIND